MLSECDVGTNEAGALPLKVSYRSDTFSGWFCNSCLNQMTSSPFQQWRYDSAETLLSNHADGSTKETWSQRWSSVLLIQKNGCGCLEFCVEKDPEVTSGLSINEHRDWLMVLHSEWNEGVISFRNTWLVCAILTLKDDLSFLHFLAFDYSLYFTFVSYAPKHIWLT